MVQKEIREICITTSAILNDDSKRYKDKLKISKQRISYKRFDFNTGDTTRFWDYMTNSDEYLNKYKVLCDEIYDFLSKATSYYHKSAITNGKFEIKIVYTDMTKVSFKFTDDFHFNKFDNLATSIGNIIPNNEIYSCLLEPKNHDYLDIEKIEKLIELFANYKKVKWVRNSNGWSYYEYEPWVYDVFHIINFSVERTGNEDLSKKNPKDFTLCDIQTRLDQIGHEERWCPNSIGEYIEEGYILKLLKRLKELYYMK